MKLTKSLKIIILALLAFVVSVAGVFMIDNTKARAATTTETFDMVPGAEIRLVGEKNEDFGIRYVAKIHKSEFNETDKFYIMIIPSGWINKFILPAIEPNTEINHEIDYYDILVNTNGKVPTGENRTINIMESTPKLNGDYYEIKGSITDVKYENSFREFFGVVYKTDADGNNRVYAEFTEGYVENLRSVSHVASVALNKGGYTTEEVGYMLNMVKNAYNANKGNASATENLPTISVADSVALALEKDKTYQLASPSNVPEGIGIDVAWTTSDENSATVEDGLVTIKSDNASADIKVKVLGTEYPMASVSKADFVLNDFSKADSYKDLRTKTSGVYDGEWQEEVTLGGETRNGVVKIANDTGVRKFYVTFDESYDVLKKIGDNFDYITVSLYFETAEDITIQNTSWSMMGETFSSNTWVDVNITKEFISAEGSESFWTYNMKSQQKAGTYSADGTITDYFWYCHARSGLGIDKDRPLLRPNYSGEGYLYVDSIAVHGNIVDVEDYVVPSIGDTFKIPTATFKDSVGAIISVETDATVTYNGSAVELVDGGFVAKSGNYNIKYAVTCGGKEYTKEITFTVAMADNMLEDFERPESLNNLWNKNSYNMSADQKAQNVWLEKYVDTVGVEKTGVVSVNGYANDMSVRFNRTAAELKSLGLDENDTISITLLWTTTASYSAVNTTVFGIALPATPINTWRTYDISIADIISANTDLNTFLEKVGSDGAGVQIKGNIGSTTTLYLAEISFVKNP